VTKKTKKFVTRFWLMTYTDLAGKEKTRLVQGPKTYRVSKVKKDLTLTCPDINIMSIKRIPRPEWSVIFVEDDHA
jgi:hypothetical protein